MYTKKLLTVAFTLLFGASLAHALPPDHGAAANQGGGNAGANAADAMLSCMAACSPHCTNAAICAYQCNTMIHQIGIGPPSLYAGLPADAATCAVLEAGAYSWYSTCSYLLAVAGGAFSTAVSSSGSSLLGYVSTALGPTASSVIGQATHADDPCGYIKDQMIQQYMTVEQCPLSTILPALGINSSILPSPK